jgi:hypothetical protein
MSVHINCLRQHARILALLTGAGAALTLSVPAWADLSPALDRMSIAVGAFQTDPDFNATVKTPYGNVQSGDTNLGKEAMPRVQADIILFDSQGLSFDYYQYNHEYTGSLANNSNVNGNAVTTIGNASLDLKLDFAKLAYKWWFGSGDTVFGVGAGAAYYKISLNANATASVNSPSASSSARFNDSYSDDTVAPLLELGVRHAISPDLRLFIDASGVKKSSGLLTGEIYNMVLGVEWFPVKNVGVVLDYGRSQINLSREDTVAANFKVKLEGPSAFIKFRF